MRSPFHCAGLLALAVLAGPAAAQHVELGGEVRPRFEVRDPVAGPLGGTTQELTSMRTRLSVDARLLEDVRAFVQLQDVRVWGSESGTTDPAGDMVDLHQGWIEVGAGDGPWSLKVGRQELSYGGQRLVGALNWAQQARSFDGVRLRLRPSAGVTVDGFATQVGDLDGGQPDEAFVGLYGMLDAAGRVDVYVLYHDRDRVIGRSGPGGLRTADQSSKVTAGGRWSATRGPLRWRLEAAYQTGEVAAARPAADPADVAAYLVAGRIGADVTESVGLDLWYDYLSGDDDPADGEFRVFDTLFATNHKFYGYMDLFLNVPAHTGGRGLQDLAVKATYAVAPHHSVGADLHSFRFAEAGGLASGHVGEELDLTYRWGYSGGLTLTAGASYFMAGDAAPVPAAPAADERMIWGYVMMDVLF